MLAGNAAKKLQKRNKYKKCNKHFDNIILWFLVEGHFEYLDAWTFVPKYPHRVTALLKMNTIIQNLIKPLSMLFFPLQSCAKKLFLDSFIDIVSIFCYRRFTLSLALLVCSISTIHHWLKKIFDRVYLQVNYLFLEKTLWSPISIP